MVFVVGMNSQFTIFLPIETSLPKLNQMVSTDTIPQVNLN